MQNNNDKFKVDRLLKGDDSLSVTEKESILQNVLTSAEVNTHPSKSVFSRVLMVAIPVAVVLCLGVGWKLFFSSTGEATNLSSPAEFTPKSAGEAALYSISCFSSNTNRCKPGEKLMFELHPPKNTHYFAAFAKHKKTETIIWYFPGLDNGQSIPATRGVVNTGIQLDSSHQQGDYIVYGIYSKAPLKKENIKSLFGHATPSAGETTTQTNDGSLIHLKEFHMGEN